MLREATARGCIAVTALLLILSPVRAEAQEVKEVSGTFQIIWGDPKSANEPPVELFALLEDGGQMSILNMDRSLTRPFGGPLMLNGKRTTLSIVMPEGGGAAAPAPGGPTPQVRVNAIRSATDEANSERSGSPIRTDVPQFTISASRATAASSKPYVTVLCKFADLPDVTPAPKSHYEALMGSTYPGVNHYWTEASEGRINLDGSQVVGWYTLPQPRSYYVTEGTLYPNLQQLANDCAGAADADVFFPSFFGVNLQFNSSLGCCSFGGGASLALDGVTRAYAMTWEADWATNALGTYAHEVGHSLGLPHSGGPYGRVYDSHWDVMSSSSWYRPPGSVFGLGTHTVSHHKDLLGWIPPERRLVATEPLSTALIERSASPGANSNYQMVKVPIPSAPGEFYTIEARKRHGYDAPLLGDAVVIHHVSPYRSVPAEVVDADGNGLVNDAGSMWTVGETFVDMQNNIRVTVDAVVGNAFQITVRQRALNVASLSAPVRSSTVQAGSGTTVTDSVQVLVSGPETSTLTWHATTRSRRLAINTTAGAGSGPLRWTAHTAGLGAGSYVDTITVTAPGAVGSPLHLISTLHISAGTSLTAGLGATSRSDSLFANWARNDSVEVRISGSDAAAATWTASKKAPWINLTTSSGTGSGKLRWSRWAGALAPGVYVDTIRVAVSGAAGSPVLLVDTLRVLETLTLSLGHSHTTIRVPEGSPPREDSVRVAMNGRWAQGGAWRVTYMNRTPTFLRPRLETTTGNGVLRFTRQPGRLGRGVYVDTLVIYPEMNWGARVIYVDTLHVESAPLSLSLGAGSRTASVVPGLSRSADSVWVLIQGDSSGVQSWKAVAPASRIVFSSADAFTPPGTGTGTQKLKWHRNVSGRAPGLYVDTITVALADGTKSVLLVDSLQVVQPPTAGVDATSRMSVALAGSTAQIADSVRVHAAGWEAEEIAWSAEWRAAWLKITRKSGKGGGMLHWSRDPSALAPGTYVDTIVVNAPGVVGSPFRIVDTFYVYAAIQPAGVLDHLLGSSGLSPEQLRFLDLIGNRNGRLDVGDVRAWLLDNQHLTSSQMQTLRGLVEAQADTTSEPEQPPTPTEKP